MTLDHVLIPTDFSACADNALTHAIDLADRFDATLHILHVVNELDPDWYGITDAQERAVTIREQIKEQAQERLQTLAPGADHDVDATVSLQLSFDVADTIREYVDERAIDLAVMGTHGRQGIDRLRLGNVADKVIRHAPCPVMTVREDVAWTTEAEDVSFDDILAPIDFSEHSHDALSVSKYFAEAYQARLHLLFVAERRVVPTFSDTGLPGVGVVEMDPEIVGNAEAALRQLDDRVEGPALPSQYHVQEGDAAETIVDFAETHGVSLIVMATRGLSGVDRFLMGSTTERVTRVAPCPVLTLSPGAASSGDGAPSEERE